MCRYPLAAANNHALEPVLHIVAANAIVIKKQAARPSISHAASRRPKSLNSTTTQLKRRFRGGYTWIDAIYRLGHPPISATVLLLRCAAIMLPLSPMLFLLRILFIHSFFASPRLRIRGYDNVLKCIFFQKYFQKFSPSKHISIFLVFQLSPPSTIQICVRTSPKVGIRYPSHLSQH